jgi:triphosphatase
MNEIELKFLVDPGSSKQLWARAKALKLTDGSPKTRTLRSIYLDTPGHGLKKAGIALRLRRDGRRWIQTVKTGAQLHGGLSQVGEAESPAPGGRLRLDAIPNEAIRNEVVGRINGAELAPVCETIIRRTSCPLSLADGTRAELALDIGTIRAGDRSGELCEAEIELLEGRPDGLFEIARALFPDGGLRFSRLSKAARGYLLADEGRIDPPLEPQNAEDVSLRGAQIAEQAARDILRGCVEQIAANMEVVPQLDDPEGPHQLRVGLRRLRSAFSVFSPVLDSPETERLKDEARWLGQEVGQLRDFDVVAKDIARREAEAHPGERGLETLVDELERKAANQRKRLRNLLVGVRAQSFMIDLVRFVETRGWLMPQDFEQTERLAAPTSSLAVQALNKRWKKVGKRARRFEMLDVEQRHELRKELKKLRYAVEFLSSLFPEKQVEPFLKRLRKLQTVFGDLNDAATVRVMFTGDNFAAPGDMQTQRAIGWLMGACEARGQYGWAGARKLWRDLKDTRPFWK